jgi:glycerol-3-phosphate acyltransferase PlsY
MNETLTNFLWIAFAFLCGALPLSYWLGRVALHVDIRQYGDGNPGGANVWRAGGKWWGMLAILLDVLKGLVPVALANFQAGLDGLALVAVALAPILGHAYTPFLGFNGGKAIAVTFGIWTGLTLWQAPVVLGLAFAFWLLVLRVEGWAILAGMLTLFLYFILTAAPWTWLAVWAGSLLLFLWKHRADFQGSPQWSRGLLGKLLPSRKP